MKGASVAHFRKLFNFIKLRTFDMTLLLLQCANKLNGKYFILYPVSVSGVAMKITEMATKTENFRTTKLNG